MTNGSLLAVANHSFAELNLRSGLLQLCDGFGRCLCSPGHHQDFIKKTVFLVLNNAAVVCECPDAQALAFGLPPFEEEFPVRADEGTYFGRRPEREGRPFAKFRNFRVRNCPNSCFVTKDSNSK